MSANKNRIRIIGIVITAVMLAGAFTALVQNASATDWSPAITATKSGTPVQMGISLSPYVEMPSAGYNPTHYYGPTSTMVQANDGTLIMIVRDGQSHVSPGDHAILVYFKSTDGGVTWDGGALFRGFTGYDARNPAAGVTSSGRIIVAYWLLENDDMANATHPSYGYMAYKTSDDNGTTWAQEYSLDPGVIGGFNTSWGSPVDDFTICSPYGKIQTFNNYRVGFTFQVINDTYGNNHTMTGFAYSDSNGALGSWQFTNMSGIGVIPTNGYNEADIAYLGSGHMIAMARIDTVSSFQMYSSVDNGATWQNRGLRGQPGLINSQRGPTLVTVKDSAGDIWVIGFFVYDTYFYSWAYGADLLANGVSAWNAPEQYYPGSTTTGWGIGGTMVMNENTGHGIYLINEGAFGSSSKIWLQDVTVTITVPRTSMLPASVHPYIVLTLSMFALMMVVQTVAFMTKSKDHSIEKNDLIELVVFLVISSIMLGFLALFLGPI